MEVKVVVAYHKPSLILDNPVYIPLQVGKALHPDIDLGMRCDNEGDNISDENGYLCELTALYWIWKNVKADAKGLFHYRRILDTDHHPMVNVRMAYRSVVRRKYLPVIECAAARFAAIADRTAEELPRLLESHDIVTTKRSVSRLRIRNFFMLAGAELIDLMTASVGRLYPSYLPFARKGLKSHRLYFGNMAVMRNDLFDEYCTFMFSVIEDIKSTLISEGYLTDLRGEKIFSRKLGYIAELLTDTFINYKAVVDSLKVRELTVAFLKCPHAMVRQIEFSLSAMPRGIHLVTREVLGRIPELPETGLLNLLIKHTSAALAINENADPDVRRDLRQIFERMVPENAPYYLHTDEGPDDMPSHALSVLVGPSLTIPVTNGRLNLGTWQGIYLCEFRDYGGPRRVVATVVG